MDEAPDIGNSTMDERRAYVNEYFQCITDCDMCGLCKVFHGMDPEIAYDDYIKGKRTLKEVSEDYR